MEDVFSFLLTDCTPLRFAILPREDAAEGGEHVEDGPRDDEVVVEHDNGRHDDHSIAQAPEQRTEFLVDGDGPEAGVLTETQLHEHQRQTRNHQHHRERNQEGTCIIKHSIKM